MVQDFRGSSQEGGVGIYTSLPRTNKRRVTTNSKTNPTTKELKKLSSRLVGEVGDRKPG